MTGKIVTVSIPFGTQAMADSIRTTLSSKAFLPYKATFAELDPAAELGDWVTADGIYSVIAKRTFNLNSFGLSDVSAETENEVTDKYPYLSKAEADVQRKFAEVSSRLTVAEGEIDLRVEKSGVIASINATPETIKIDASKVDITGFVTFSNLSTAGQTTINGANITTGTISADRISTNISTVAKYLYVGGNSAYSDGAGIYLGNQIQILKSSGASYFIANSYPLSINCASYITLSGTYINLSASTVYTGNTISMDSSSWGISEISSSGNIQLSPSSSGYVVITSAVCGYSSLRPISNAGLDLGSSSYKWGNAYCATGAWSGSDRNNKKDIDYDIDSMDSFFDNIRPCSYKFKDGTSGRTHYGFIAQDIEDNLTSEGLTGIDFAGFGKDKLMEAEYDDDGHFLREVETDNDTYFLRYEEFIALCVSQIQKLKARVTELEANLN